MASSKLKAETTLCIVRREEVALLPEEKVRQRLLAWMVNTLGYPIAHLAVEKALAQLPHLAYSPTAPPDRRADILCFARGLHPAYDLYPLLLIECKAAEPLTPKVERQVIGYNHYVGAYFIALANEKEIKTGWFQKNSGYTFAPGLPPYDALIKSASL